MRYPRNPDRLLDRLVLDRHGLNVQPPFGMRVHDERYCTLKKRRMTKAALANGFYVGVLPAHLRNATGVVRLLRFLFE